jgi:hypothetical protein
MSTVPVSPRESPRTIGIRVEADVFERLQAAARKRKVTVTGYCRDVLAAHIHHRPMSPDEVSTEEVYRATIKILEDVVWLKKTLPLALATLLRDQYFDANLTDEQKERVWNSLVDGPQRTGRPAASDDERKAYLVKVRATHKPKRGDLVTFQMKDADLAKRADARARLLED